MSWNELESEEIEEIFNVRQKTVIVKIENVVDRWDVEEIASYESIIVQFTTTWHQILNFLETFPVTLYDPSVLLLCVTFDSIFILTLEWKS